MYKLKHYGYLFLINIYLITPIIAEANDYCFDRKVISLGTVLCGEKNIEASQDVPNTCGFNNASVWYSFTTVATGDYVIEITNSSFNDVLTLFSGGCNNLIEIACTNNEEYGFKGEKLYNNLSGNTQYYIMVSGAECTFGRTLGKFCIEVRKATPNDNPTTTLGDCSQASVVNFDGAGNPIMCIVGTNLNSSKADPKPSCSVYAGASTWYKLIAGTTGVLKLEVAPNFSQIVSVYSGSCGNMNEIACSLNGESTGERMLINLSDPAMLYYIQISGNFNGVAADYSDVNLCNNSDFYIDMSLSSYCLTEYIGTPCDDNNSSTSNDLIRADCECLGSCLLEGNKCDDGDPNTIGEVFDLNCNCIGDCGNQGAACDDGDPNTMNDVFDASCNCKGICVGVTSTCLLGYVWNSGSCECEPSCILNMPCDDENIYTGDGVWDTYCNCIASCMITCTHENINVLFLPNEYCKCECYDFGKACDDGNAGTENDKINVNCNCEGTPVEKCKISVTITANNVTENYFEASQTIQTDTSSDAVIEISTSLKLSAGVEIMLNPGFTIISGATFHGYIEGCDL